MYWLARCAKRLLSLCKSFILFHPERRHAGHSTSESRMDIIVNVTASAFGSSLQEGKHTQRAVESECIAKCMKDETRCFRESMNCEVIALPRRRSYLGGYNRDSCVRTNYLKEILDQSKRVDFLFPWDDSRTPEAWRSVTIPECLRVSACWTIQMAPLLDCPFIVISMLRPAMMLRGSHLCVAAEKISLMNCLTIGLNVVEDRTIKQCGCS